mmetsp:Transcript_32979/g.48372  ORF Transcript_32979/g.48372 Transcript_32979/m.48372 type:complete len:85 (-) Transcript_32979:283-537(-)
MKVSHVTKSRVNMFNAEGVCECETSFSPANIVPLSSPSIQTNGVFSRLTMNYFGHIGEAFLKKISIWIVCRKTKRVDPHSLGVY